MPPLKPYRRQTEASRLNRPRMRSSSLLERARDTANEVELPLIGGVGDALSSLLSFDPRDTMSDVVNPMQIPAAAMTSVGKRALTPAIDRVRAKIAQRFGQADPQGLGLGRMFDDAMRKKNVRPTVVNDFADVMDDYDLEALLDIAGDTPGGRTSNFEGLVNHPNFMDKVQMGSASSLHTPLETSTRVKEARRALEQAGIDTQMARQIVPRRGTQAASFQRGLNSILPSQNPSAWDDYSRIEDIIGPGYTDLGRQGLGGISPKRVLKSAGGDLYMHKGTAFQQGAGAAGNYAEARPDVIALAEPDFVGQEDTVSKLAQLLSQGNKTPWARGVREGGSLQPFLHNKMDLQDLTQAGIDPFRRDPRLVHQLQDEQVVDTLLQVTDRHPGQFVLSPDNSTLYSIDKGLGRFARYRTPNIVQPADGPVYTSLDRGRMLNQDVDPRVYQEAARRMKQVPENELRSAMNPAMRAMNLPGTEQDSFFRNFLQSREMLPQLFDDFYRRFVQP